MSKLELFWSGWGARLSEIQVRLAMNRFEIPISSADTAYHCGAEDHTVCQEKRPRCLSFRAMEGCQLARIALSSANTSNRALAQREFRYFRRSLLVLLSYI